VDGCPWMQAYFVLWKIVNRRNDDAAWISLHLMVRTILQGGRLRPIRGRNLRQAHDIAAHNRVLELGSATILPAHPKREPQRFAQLPGHPQ
jgi:hypothetical protein